MCFHASGAQFRPQIGPEMIPKTAQEAPKTAQEAPNAAQDAPETAPKATRTAQEDVLGPRGADLGRLGESRRPLAAMGGALGGHGG